MSGFSAATYGSNHSMHYSEKKDIGKIGEKRKSTFVIKEYEHNPGAICGFEKDEKFLSDSKER